MEELPAAKRRTQDDTAAVFVAAFSEPAEGESLDARHFWQLKEHVAVVQQQCDDARSQLLTLKLAREEDVLRAKKGATKGNKGRSYG